MKTATVRRSTAAIALLPALSAGLLITTALGAVSRGHAAVTAAPVLERLTIRATAPRIPRQIPAGILAITLINDTRSDAGIDVARANPGATLAQIAAADAATNSNGPNRMKGFIRLTQLVTFLGGLSSVPVGASGTALVDLRTPGTYGLHMDSGDGPSGKTTIITVAPSAGAGTAFPAADLTVRLKDFKFLGLPKQLAEGRITLRAINQGPSVHEMDLARLDPGKTQRDLLALLRSPQGQDGPPPSWVHFVGGINSISAHQRVEVQMTLTPGYYVTLCFMPDIKKHGMPHVMEGMIGHFTVR